MLLLRSRNKLFIMFTYRYLRKSTIIFPLRNYCDSDKLVPKSSIQKAEQGSNLVEPLSFSKIQVQYWNESFQVKRQRTAHSGLRSIKNIVDVLRYVQNLKNFPLTPTELIYYFKRKYIRDQLAEQIYMPQRVAILRPDLAAAHFITGRGGAIKFVGLHDWIGIKEKKKMLPLTYVPGMYIESIKADNTGLCYEGLENLAKLKFITYLSLKNLETVNDWFLDWISKEYYLSLKHLDLSGCKNVTYRGLSSFYRFECLATLEVEGIPDTPEFKLACIMLQDVMPNLDIKGIDLSVPEKISPVNAEETKHIQKS